MTRSIGEPSAANGNWFEPVIDRGSVVVVSHSRPPLFGSVRRERKSLLLSPTVHFAGFFSIKLTVYGYCVTCLTNDSKLLYFSYYKIVRFKDFLCFPQNGTHQLVRLEKWHTPSKI